MKILVIQLARPGDIFSSWPVLSALRRENPKAEIHFLTREKFAPQPTDFRAVDHFWKLNSKNLLEPIIEDGCKINESTQRLRNFVQALQSERFDKIINLTFSPASSFLTHLIGTDGCEVRGYTRSADFYLFVPDEASQYFRSQVGVSKANRIHIYDLFAMVAGVELSDSDLTMFHYNLPRQFVVCHLGASQIQKVWPVENWSRLIEKLAETESVILVGGKDDISRGEAIAKNPRVQNFIGKTTFSELAKILSQAKLFIGADSGPLHVANMTGTRSLNLSLGAVNFWETGPSVLGSQVLVSPNPQNLSADEVFLAAKSMISGEGSNLSIRLCDGQKFVRYDDFGQDFDSGWPTIQWLYFSGQKPKLNLVQKRLASQIGEVCEISKQQILAFKNDTSKTQCLSVLVQTDEILKIIGQTDRVFMPLLDRFFGQKENIPPAEQPVIIEQTLKVYEELKTKIGESCV